MAVLSATFLEYQRFDFLRAQYNIGDRVAHRQLVSAEMEVEAKQAEEELSKLNAIETQVTTLQPQAGSSREEIKVSEATLAAKRTELQAMEDKLSLLIGEARSQENRVAAAASTAQEPRDRAPDVGSDEEDLKVIAEIDGICLCAIGAINNFLGL